MGQELSLVWVLPFVGILLSIGLFPLFAPHFWHHHYPKVAVGWAVLLAAPFLGLFGHEAWHKILHVYLVDYIPFVILLWALFTISGGILVGGTLRGTPIVNSMLILIGTAIASWIGTTGASMLLIRPLLRANAHRQHKVHTVIFFIFLVSNIGGSLTPLGDPPLFLGFLHSVPFFWTLQYLWPQMLATAGIVLAMYFVLDSFWYLREPPESREAIAGEERQPIVIRGKRNLLFLAMVVGGVLLSGYWKPEHIHYGSLVRHGAIVVIGDEASDTAHEATHADEQHNGASTSGHSSVSVPEHGSAPAPAHASHAGLSIPLQNVARDVLLVLAGILSLLVTPRDIRDENGFSWAPIVEVAWLFFGIFMTIIPALEILQAGESGALAFLVRSVDTPAHYFWAAGLLSSFLDNAPTYLTFFNTAIGRFHPGLPEAEAVKLLIAEHNKYLVGIACGAVFMGANTYIGNAPNFMVRSIAEEAGLRMPDFFSYIFKYSLPILGMTFALVTWIFF